MEIKETKDFILKKINNINGKGALYFMIFKDINKYHRYRNYILAKGYKIKKVYFYPEKGEYKIFYTRITAKNMFERIGYYEDNKRLTLLQATRLNLTL